MPWGRSNLARLTYGKSSFANGAWTRVDELGPGDVVQSRGEDLEVVEVLRTQRFETVYNFTVSNHHTYFVGENAAWVHNTCFDEIVDNVLNGDRISTALSKSDSGHRAASFLRKPDKLGKIAGGDGIEKTILQTKGKLNDSDGIFEYIVTSGGGISHQRFIKGGDFTPGIVNQRVKKNDNLYINYSIFKSVTEPVLGTDSFWD